ncbi:deaminase, partial [Bordetella pertussis]|uniref:deaminase n=1 Tax=Bordetella pertussis TaxID=520 RepID=UPI000AF94F50
NARAGGRPFGALVAKDGVVLARGVNRMLADHDPTAHTELLALREAGRALRSARLDGAWAPSSRPRSRRAWARGAACWPRCWR